MSSDHTQTARALIAAIDAVDRNPKAACLETHLADRSVDSGTLRAMCERLIELETDVDDWRRMCRQECRDCMALRKAARRYDGIHCFRHPDEIDSLRVVVRLNSEEK